MVLARTYYKQRSMSFATIQRAAAAVVDPPHPGPARPSESDRFLAGGSPGPGRSTVSRQLQVAAQTGIRGSARTWTQVVGSGSFSLTRRRAAAVGVKASNEPWSRLSNPSSGRPRATCNDRAVTFGPSWFRVRLPAESAVPGLPVRAKITITIISGIGMTGVVLLEVRCHGS